jgi:hypothetical protein
VFVVAGSPIRLCQPVVGLLRGVIQRGTDFDCFLELGNGELVVAPLSIDNPELQVRRAQLGIKTNRGAEKGIHQLEILGGDPAILAAPFELLPKADCVVVIG